MKITVDKNRIFCRVERSGIKHVTPALKWVRHRWIQGRYGRIKKSQDASFIDGRSGLFLFGLLPRVVNHLKNKNIPVTVASEKGYRIVTPDLENPVLIGMTPREDQLNAILEGVNRVRGVIVSPTATGKTVTMMGLLSMYPLSRVLIMCHSTDIVIQTAARIKKNVRLQDDDEVAILGGGSKPRKDPRIVVATIQSVVNLNPEAVRNLFDIVIIDEAHHVRSRTSQYAKVLMVLNAPMKLGFTATPPKKAEEYMAMEGLLGPVIYRMSINEAQALNIISKPHVVLLNTPLNTKVFEIKKYRATYQKGVVENRQRNWLVVNTARAVNELGYSALIIVKEILHGKELLAIARMLNVQMDFVQGSTTKTDRQEAKEALDRKEIKTIITTDCWREGVDIPSLNVVINACGGKSEIKTLQAIGRGLRRPKGKTNMVVFDFLDPYRHLAEHSIERLQLYNGHGWVNIGGRWQDFLEETA